MLSLLAGAYVGLGYTTALQAAGLMDQAPSNPDRSSVSLKASLLSFLAPGHLVQCGFIVVLAQCCSVRKGLQGTFGTMKNKPNKPPIVAGGQHTALLHLSHCRLIVACSTW